jgi:hypothetical protein
MMGYLCSGDQRARNDSANRKYLAALCVRLSLVNVPFFFALKDSRHS